MAKSRIPLNQLEVLAERRRQLLEQAVAELDLDVRIVNSLEDEAGVVMVSDLVALTEEDLYGIRNLGPASIARLRAVLQEAGLDLAPSRPPAS